MPSAQVWQRQDYDKVLFLILIRSNQLKLGAVSNHTALFSQNLIDIKSIQ
jgi:hypothetical protein